MADEVPAVPAPIADPAPLGLAAFALTTFLLSAANANWMGAATGDAWLGYALAYGGAIQLLAGMWEFRNRNVFGATAFSTYGGFWIGLFLWVQFVAPHAASAAAAGHDLGWILLAFAIFNTYMLIMSTQLNIAVFGVFLTLEITEIVLFIGNFAGNIVDRSHRRLHRRPHRAGRLVHLRRRRGQRHWRPDQAPGRAPLLAATAPVPAHTVAA